MDYPAAPPPTEGGFTPFETTFVLNNVRMPAADGKLHGSTKHSLVAWAHARAAATRLPDLGQIKLTLTWVVSDKRLRRTGHLQAIAAALAAGLHVAGVVQHREQIVDVSTIVEWRGDSQPHLELTVTRVDPDPEATERRNSL